MSFVMTITRVGSSLRNKQVEHPAGPQWRAGWGAPSSAPGLGQRQARLWVADAVPRLAPGPACWRVAWLERILPGPQDPSASSAMTWPIPNACMPKVTVCLYPAKFSTVQPLLIPLRREGRRDQCLKAFPHLPPAFRRLPPAFLRHRPRVKRSRPRLGSCSLCDSSSAKSRQHLSGGKKYRQGVEETNRPGKRHTGTKWMAL